MLSERHLRTHDHPTTRVEMLTDGVFAIAMTILVLELHVPEAVEPGHLGEALAELAPKLFTYALSFLVLGVYWVGHH